MTEIPLDNPNPSPQPAAANANESDLWRLLRRKEGTWVNWGQACQQLQKAGCSAQKIFEETGFEPVQQNQIIVAFQVYTSMVNAGVGEEARLYYARTGSDSLYELRILTQAERAATAEFLFAKNLDSEAAHEVARAVKEFSRLGTLPQGFTNHPGDAVAYQYWRFAKAKTDLQERSRLIAKGLMFAHSQTGRQQIELLLTDFTLTPKRPAPILPLYRLEADDELPQIVPIAGEMPLAPAELSAVPAVEKTGAFQIVKISWDRGWVSIPGWQVVLKAEDPVAIFCHTSQLPVQLEGKVEDVLILIDRANTEWDTNSYFIVEQSGQLQLQWFEEATDLPLLGKLILVLRPKRIVDEESTKDLWQMDD